VLQPRKRALRPGAVAGRRSRNTESAESVVPCEVQVRHEGKAPGLVYETDDFLAPSVRPCVVNCADCADCARCVAGQAAGRRELVVHEREVFAERKPLREPVRTVMQ
jgi:hypothetical protein